MSILTLTVLAPLIGFLLLAICRDGRFPEYVSAVIGCGSILISAISALVVAISFDGQAQSIHLWQWFSVGNLASNVNFHYDGLTLVMVGVITGVGLLIHIFSTWYMKGEEHFARFLSYMNLFVACMLVLVLADNYLLLYFGWEGVGICSYLLIGFYYKDRKNSSAAMKAFIITRIGDVFLVIAIFMIYYQVGSLNIQTVNEQIPSIFNDRPGTVYLIAFLLMMGAFGKSAQLPLQTWLPDAMAGPTPISALIHAATMVTAGVYLIARTHSIFDLATGVAYLISIIGAITLLLAGFTALRQYDIKKILAYSTMSQLGYMFLALGIGAYDQAIRHLMIHAFFKALLFLSAGAVIIAMHHEQDIRKMGGLYKRIPLVYICFLIGCSALVALPWISAGFYSKDDILWTVWASGNTGLFFVALLGAFITSVYTFRVFYLTFHGEIHQEPQVIKGWNYWLPLVVLAILSTFVGALIYLPVHDVLPENLSHLNNAPYEHQIESLTIVVALSGLLFAFYWFRKKKSILNQTNQNSALMNLVANGFGFDALYRSIFIKPYLWIAARLHADYIDRAWFGIEKTCGYLFAINQRLQTGKIRDYAVTFSLGITALLFILIFFQV